MEGSTLQIDLTEDADRVMATSGLRITLPASECAKVQSALLVLLA
jgi:hypothetical protein